MNGLLNTSTDSMFSATPAKQNGEPTTGIENTDIQNAQGLNQGGKQDGNTPVKPSFFNFYNFLGKIDTLTVEGRSELSVDAKLYAEDTSPPTKAAPTELNLDRKQALPIAVAKIDIKTKMTTDISSDIVSPIITDIPITECIICEIPPSELPIAINTNILEGNEVELPLINGVSLLPAQETEITIPTTGTLNNTGADKEPADQTQGNQDQDLAGKQANNQTNGIDLKTQTDNTALPFAGTIPLEQGTLSVEQGTLSVEQEKSPLEQGKFAQFLSTINFQSKNKQDAITNIKDAISALSVERTSPAIKSAELPNDGADIANNRESDIDNQSEPVAPKENHNKFANISGGSAPATDTAILTASKIPANTNTISSQPSIDPFNTTSLLASTGISQSITSSNKSMNSNVSNAISEQVANAIKASAIDSKITARIAGQIAGSSDIIVRLDPADLGRVNISFTFENANSVTAQISTDNAATLSVLKDRSEMLLVQLRQNGFENVTLNFDSANSGSSFEQDQNSEFSKQFGQDEKSSPAQKTQIFETRLEEEDQEKIPSSTKTVFTNDTVDIKL